jgi:hypothetical protein
LAILPKFSRKTTHILIYLIYPVYLILSIRCRTILSPQLTIFTICAKIYWMENFREFLRSKRNLASLLVLAFIALSLPLGLYLLKQQQTYKSSAAGELIALAEGPCIETINGKKVAVCNTIPLKLYNPFATTSASPSTSASSSASPSSPDTTSKLFTPRDPVLRVNQFNSTAIQAALNQIKDSGGAVYLPAGTYTITEKIRMFSNTTLFGDGIDQTILQLDPSLLTNEDGILGNDTNYGHKNIVVRDLTLKGLGQESGALQCCVGIKLRQLDGGLFYKIKVEGFSWHGIWMVYKQQNATSGGSDTVKNVRISNSQIINNKGNGIAIDSPSSENVVDMNTFSGNNSGTGEDNYLKSGGAISLSMDEDGAVSQNKILNNSVTNNGFRGISVMARNNITAIAQKVIPNNAICNNIVQNNGEHSIVDANSEDSIYIANQISGDNGKVYTGAFPYYDQSITRWDNTPGNTSTAMIEDESPSATNPDCKIKDKLQTIPAAPTKPAAHIQSKSVLAFLPHFVAQAQTATPSASNSPSPVASAPATTSYRLAETQAGLSSASWISYNSSPIVTNFTVSNTPGTKEIWVQFINPSGQSLTDHIPAFELLPPSPTISGVNCTMDITNKNLKVTVTGTNLGLTKGTVTANGTAMEVASWDNSTIVGLLTSSTIPTTGQKYSVIVKRADLLQSTAQTCQVNTSAVSLGARVFCRAPGKFDVSNVVVTIAPLETPDKKVEETVTIDKDGVIQGIKTKLQIGQQYIITAKAPKTLRRNTTITAQEGTTVVNTNDGKPFILPIGDIAPSTPDGQINGLDRAELVKQWRVLSSSASGTLTADFNQDNKVNSIDWACMKYDFNSKDDVPGNTTGSSYTNGLNVSTGQGSAIFSF